jgi:alpha-L-arabinofuranosidase
MTEAQEVKLIAVGGSIPEKCKIIVLTHEDVHACNTFENPKEVVPETRETTIHDGILTIPPASVVMLYME